MVVQDETGATEEPVAVRRVARWRTILRASIGIVGPLIFVFIAIITSGDVDKAGANASAVQITQIYAADGFDTMIFFAICVSLYILSRAGE